MIKAIFFDLDGVLTKDEGGSTTTCRNLHEKTGIPFEKIYPCYRKNVHLLNTGKAVHKDVWEDFCDCMGKKIDINLLDQALRNVQINEKVIEIARSLKGRYRLGIITDNGSERFQAIADEFRLDELFEYMIVSADVASLKHDNTLIFDKALEAMGVKPEESVFIDNRQDNLEIPKEMGLKTIFFDFEKNDVNQLKEDLKASGVELI
jgi:HAD superfamily hydrolase (TIGR01509 family)